MTETTYIGQSFPQRLHTFVSRIGSSESHYNLDSLAEQLGTQITRFDLFLQYTSSAHRLPGELAHKSSSIYGQFEDDEFEVVPSSRFRTA